jgi:hypothetical protein
MFKSQALLAFIVVGLAAAPLQASIIQSNDHIPPPALHANNQIVYNTPGGVYKIDSFFDIFTDLTTSPPAPGTSRIDSFFDVFTELTIEPPGGGPVVVDIPNTHMSQQTSAPSGSTGTYNTEMLALDISGGGLPPGVMIRESPTLQSPGQTTVQPIGGGLYKIDSFFDVFTELSIDNGQTWAPGSAAMVATGMPEPASLSLVVIGGIALLRRHPRRYAA